MKSGLSIGDVAKRSGCPVATIRYYEEIGLLKPAERSAAGRRLYGRPDIARLRLIRRLRLMDLGIDAVRTFLAAMSAPAPSCLNLRDLARNHLDVVRRRRTEIEALEKTLAGLVGSCSDACASGPTPDCTILSDFGCA